MPKGVTTKALEIDERRRKVAQLYLRRQTQTEIARVLGVTQQTISLDIIELRKQWAAESVEAIEEVKVREAAELDEMEAEAAVEFSKRKNWEWFDRRLKCKERRAKLLGLDAPVKSSAEVSGPGGGPISFSEVVVELTDDGSASSP
jgi:predicted transcriptional regulator